MQSELHLLPHGATLEASASSCSDNWQLHLCGKCSVLAAAFIDADLAVYANICCCQEAFKQAHHSVVADGIYICPSTCAMLNSISAAFKT